MPPVRASRSIEIVPPVAISTTRGDDIDSGGAVLERVPAVGQECSGHCPLTTELRQVILFDCDDLLDQLSRRRVEVGFE